MKKLIITMIAIIAMVSMMAAFDRECIKEIDRSPYTGHQQMMQGEFGEHFKGMHKEFENKYEQLNLSEEQKEQMQTIRIEHQKEQIKLHSEIKILQIEKQEALRKHNFEQARKTTIQINNLNEKLSLAHINLMEKHWNLLTEEQKSQISSFKKKLPQPRLRKQQ